MAGIYDERILGAQQQKEFARRLRDQAAEPAGQMVSGWYVPNTGGAVVSALRNMMGAYQENKADEELKGIEREKAQFLADTLGQAGIAAPSYLLKQAGTAEQQPGFIDKAVSFLRGQDQPQATPATPYKQNVAQNVTPEQRDAALMNLYGIDSSQAAPMIAHEQFKLQQQQAADLKREALQARQEEALANRQSREEIARMADQTRRDMAALSASNRPERYVNVLNPESGESMLIPENMVEKGMQKWTPQASKNISEKKAKEKSLKGFQDTLDYLGQQYTDLDKQGAIQSESHPLSNVTSVPFNRWTSGFLGNETKTTMSNINQARSSLFQDFKNMTGMTASQINTDKELQNAMNTLTDPNSTIESNKSALNFLSKRYGTGDVVFPEQSAPSSGWNIKEVK